MYVRGRGRRRTADTQKRELREAATAGLMSLAESTGKNASRQDRRANASRQDRRAEVGVICATAALAYLHQRVLAFPRVLYWSLVNDPKLGQHHCSTAAKSDLKHNTRKQ